MARSKAPPPPILDPVAERVRRIRGRDRAVLIVGSACAVLMFALGLLHAGGS